MPVSKSHIAGAVREFRYYKDLAERAMGQVPDEALFDRIAAQNNSIAIIAGHLAGNMRSRWTDFLTSDGEKGWRQRDQEFEPVFNTRAEMMKSWDNGWSTVFNALENLDDTYLDSIVYIRNQGHTVREAIDRQLAHYAYHIGQIVYLCRMFAGDEWKSLTIPKGGSVEFNKEKFNEEKKRKHYTERNGSDQE